MIIRYLSVGRPAVLPGTDTLSAIVKSPVEGEVHLGKLGFAGDEQADLEHHGGPDKAVCCYSYDNYPYWEKSLNRTLGPSAFGENLTVEGATEADVRIGDLYRVGGATVQVCQPRIPCFKVDKKFGLKGMVERMTDTGFTGFYLRVLEEGPVRAGDRFTLLKRNEEAPMVAFANRILYHEPTNRQALEMLLNTPHFAPAWLKSVQKRLAALR